jgi:hypothetical protein
LGERNSEAAGLGGLRSANPPYGLIHSQKYSLVDQFLAEFAACCRIVPPNFEDGGDNMSGFDQLAGYRTVRVAYVKRYLGDDGIQKTAPVSAQVAVSYCGVGRSYR